MSSPAKPLTERAAAYFTELSSAAIDLNKASDELGSAINTIDSVLQRLNLGVPTWVKIHGGEDQYQGAYYWSRDLGYAKVGKRWGIALCTREGCHYDPDEEKTEEWLFNDAPRWLRVEGVMKIPDLLESLVKQTKETTEKIKGKTTEAHQLAAVISETAEKLNRKPKK